VKPSSYARDRRLDQPASEALVLMGVLEDEGEICLRAVDPLPPPDTVNAVGIV
jgi:hypothetical protein